MKLLAAFLVTAALAGGCALRPTPIADAAAPEPTATPMPPPVSVAPPPSVASALAPNETQVGRYTTVTTQPAEADTNPMAVIAKVHFPREVVSSVGDAVRYVLIRTGYQLVPDAALDPRVKAVFALRLPDNQRVLGPYRVDAMLQVLMGQPYRLVADPASRTVTYVGPSTLGAPMVDRVPAPATTSQQAPAKRGAVSQASASAV